MSSPQIRIGDTVRLLPNHGVAPGAIGVVMAEELWLDDNTTVDWEGIGKRPVYEGALPNVNDEGTARLLVFMSFPEEPIPDHKAGWWSRCRKHPHKYPYCSLRNLELVSGPETKQLNDRQELGSWSGFDKAAGVSAVSDSQEGVRRNIAHSKQSQFLQTYPKLAEDEPHKESTT